MNTKALLSLLPAAFLTGVIGGMIGSFLAPVSQRTATYETVRVTKELVVATSVTDSKGCRISADGTVTATGGFVGNQVRGNLIVGRSLIASLNSTQQPLDQQQIAAEITANPERGGEMILRSRAAVFCPANGPAKRGQETFIGFNKENGSPAMFTQDIEQGQSGRAFVVCMKPKAAVQQSTEAQQSVQQPSGQQQYMRQQQDMTDRTYIPHRPEQSLR